MAEQPGEQSTGAGGPSPGVRLLLAGAGLGALLGLGLGWSIGQGPFTPAAVPPSTCASVDAAPTSGGAPASGSPGAEGALEARLGEVRRLMGLRAWEAPADGNVRLLLAELRSRWGSDPRVLEIQREAAERALADALGLESIHRRELAAGRVRLALEWVPELPGARELLGRLERMGADAASDGLELAPLPTRLPDRGPLPPPLPLAPEAASGKGGP